MLEHADGGEIGKMSSVVFLAFGSGDKTAFRVVVDHGGRERVLFAEPDHLPVHIAEDLIHIQGKVRQLLPVHRALLAQPLP